MTQFRPMLAPNKVVDPYEFEYPCYGSFKLDGMRLLVQSGGFPPSDDFAAKGLPIYHDGEWTQPLTRSLKPVENHFARYMLSCLPHGLDGELCVLRDDGTVDFRGSMSALRKHEGEPAIRFFLFDNFALADETFDERYQSLLDLKKAGALPDWVEVLEQRILNSPEEAIAMNAEARALGHEGLILKKIKARYKHNRCTEKEQIMSKMKPKKTIEVVVIGCTQGFTNTNEQTRDERGFAKRSSKKEGKVANDMIGAYVVLSPDYDRPFEVSASVDHDIKRAHLLNKPIGMVMSIEFADDGVYDVPRTASPKGERPRQDIDDETWAKLEPLVLAAIPRGCVVEARLYKPGKPLLTEPFPERDVIEVGETEKDYGFHEAEA